MHDSFSMFLAHYLDVWRESSITEMKRIISHEYKAREITDGAIDDFGYEESINGWEQGFKFAKENNAQWELNVLSILPLREGEAVAIITATMVIQGESLETANLFFQTFQRSNPSDWKLVRSYIEAGIPYDKTYDKLCH